MPEDEIGTWYWYMIHLNVIRSLTTTARPIRRPSPPTGIPGVRFRSYSYNPSLFKNCNDRMGATLAYLAWSVYKHNMHPEFGENSLLDIAHSLVHGG